MDAQCMTAQLQSLFGSQACCVNQTPSFKESLIWRNTQSSYNKTQTFLIILHSCWTYLTAVCEVLFSLFFTPRFYQLNRGAQVCSFDLSSESFHVGSTLTASCYSHNAPLTWCYTGATYCAHMCYCLNAKSGENVCGVCYLIRCMYGIFQYIE